MQNHVIEILQLGNKLGLLGLRVRYQDISESEFKVWATSHSKSKEFLIEGDSGFFTITSFKLTRNDVGGLDRIKEEMDVGVNSLDNCIKWVKLMF